MLSELRKFYKVIRLLLTTPFRFVIRYQTFGTLRQDLSQNWFSFWALQASFF